MDAGADDAAAWIEGPQGRRHKRSVGGEDDRCLERLRRRLGAGAGPLGAELAREALAALVAGPGERKHAPALVDGHLADHVRGRAEAVEPEPGRVAGEPERPIADQAATKQRRRLLVG